MQREYCHLFPPLQALIITQTIHPPGDFFCLSKATNPATFTGVFGDFCGVWRLESTNHSAVRPTVLQLQWTSFGGAQLAKGWEPLLQRMQCLPPSGGTCTCLLNSKEKKTYLLFTGMLLNVNITVHVDIQFPTKKFSVKTVDCMFCMQIPVKLKHKSHMQNTYAVFVMSTIASILKPGVLWLTACTLWSENKCSLTE